MQQCIKILFHIYMKVNMFRATHRPSECEKGTFSYSTWQRPATTCPATFHVCKTRGC